MLRWLKEEVKSPFGDVKVWNWAVDETAESDGDAVDPTPDLDDAEDQLGAVLWNSNSVVLDYLYEHVFSGTLAANVNILELGSGVGALGIALAAGGARVAITDIKELVPLMMRNIKLNAKTRKGECLASCWKWGDPMPQSLKTYFEPQGVQYVLMCDALYGNPKDWPALIRTLNEISEHSNTLTVLNFCEQRVDSVENGFLALLAADNSWKASLPTTLDAKSGLDMSVRVTTIRKLASVNFGKKSSPQNAAHAAKKRERED